jgi:Fe2+ or Zn2+ uptake regulation protein
MGRVSSAPDYAEQLRMADLRVTRPRVAVLEAVRDHPHADTDTIYSTVRQALPDVSRQAVYDVLNALTAVGLVRAWWLGTSPASVTTTTMSYAGRAGSLRTSIVRSVTRRA